MYILTCYPDVSSHEIRRVLREANKRVRIAIPVLQPGITVIKVD